MTTMTVPAGRAAGRAPQLDLKNAASAYLLRHCQGLSRPDAIEACAVELMTRHDISEATAELQALQAHAELETLHQAAWVDVDATTSSVVVMRTSGGKPVAFTVNDLLAMREHALEQGTLRCTAARPRQ
ncbi:MULTISPECIES: hypothetical protein [Chromohalobacter]|uniref:hypothetical protein n=1 Tax=Chromohalobacter TaxID=42054 RepID=UPI0015C43E06|nr:hypothetical protein [Chromohalobacter salexigens]NWO55019.1 hypothetical protein [Chromohalobacter salexigens]